MEKLKLPEEEIIKLGKKLVTELQLEQTPHTLGKWMAHYVAELILQIESCQDENIKATKKRECFEIVLKLWSLRENIPTVSTPLSGLDTMFELLDVLSNDKPSYFLRVTGLDIPEKPTAWKEFMQTLAASSESILRMCLYSAVSKKLLEDKKIWSTELKNTISEEELRVLELLTDLVNKSNVLIIGSEEKEDVGIILEQVSPEERYRAILDKIESEINEITSTFKKLKDSILLHRSPKNEST